ncbi:hypothetical protein SAMN04488518_11761 [Pseudovibrio ascidiaceicola]|uniref:Uncharacterized protein n=1 Tax=Pseudovibrio ascidiaceicola TaxID=285279 RepID=A0A1I4F393_9HYPH|nr:hypothetical protein SAMN04488518_11761 [Pseudovibrio ascidiaceicola]
MSSRAKTRDPYPQYQRLAERLSKIVKQSVIDPGSKAGMTQEEADGLTRKKPALIIPHSMRHPEPPPTPTRTVLDTGSPLRSSGMTEVVQQAGKVSIASPPSSSRTSAARCGPQSHPTNASIRTLVVSHCPHLWCHPGPRAGTHTVIASNRECRACRDLTMGPGSPLHSARDDSDRKPIG